MDPIDELYESEMEALFQFSKAFLEQKTYSLKEGFSPYVNDWRKFYMGLKRQRQQAEVACRKPDGCPTS